MKIGLLKCGSVLPKFFHLAGDYNDMYKSLLNEFAPEVELVVYDVTKNDYPSSIDEVNGYLTTGSRYSVYNNEPWILRFRDFIRTLYEKRKKVVGICFGHQMIAHAMGGVVEKSDNGWGIGMKKVNIIKTMPWMDPPLKELNLLYCHQDQVVNLPPRAELLGESPHCPYAVFQLENHFLSIQAHPEFVIDYARDLMLFLQEMIGRETVTDAMETLHVSPDKLEITRWIVNFIRDDSLFSTPPAFGK